MRRPRMASVIWGWRLELALAIGSFTMRPGTVRRLLHNGRIAYQRVSARRAVIRETALRAYVDTVSFGLLP